jgi:hypothetical protein
MSSLRIWPCSLLFSKPNIFLSCVRSHLEFSATILKNHIWLEYCDPFGYKSLKRGLGKCNYVDYFFVRKLSKLWMTAAETEWRYLTSILQIFDLKYRKKEFLQKAFAYSIVWSCCFPLDNSWKWESPRFLGIQSHQHPV